MRSRLDPGLLTVASRHRVSASKQARMRCWPAASGIFVPQADCSDSGPPAVRDRYQGHRQLVPDMELRSLPGTTWVSISWIRNKGHPRFFRSSRGLPDDAAIVE